jgi:type IV pilus assembly protein PilY1
MKYLMLIAALLTALVSQVHADDTEIFTGGNNSAASNVIFLIDTSGSMDKLVQVSPPPYKNTEIYDSKYGFIADKYYAFRPPNGGLNIDNHFQVLLNNQLNADQIICNSALNSANSSGEYADKLSYSGELKTGWLGGQYRTWEGPKDYGQNNNFDITPTSNDGQLRCGAAGSFFKADQYFARLYNGNYLNYLSMNETNEDPVFMERLEIVVAAAKDTIKSLPDNVNVSLMRFNEESNQGGRVIVSMRPAKANYELFEAALDKLDHDGATPLTESFYEAGLYMLSKEAKYGSPENNNTKNKNGNYSTNDDEVSVLDSLNGNYYDMPVLSACATTQKIILFTDGQPTSDNDANSLIENDVNNLISGSKVTFKGVDIYKNCSGDSSGILYDKSYNHGRCMEEFAYYLFTEYGIITDTIGGFTGASIDLETKLNNTATAGGGKFYPADNYQAIKDALLDSSVETIISPATFTSPAVAVSSYNSLELSDELYYAVFEPNNTSAWRGNLKKYKIASSGVVDANKASAVDPSTGFFATSAQSFWSEAADGNEVEKGGAASMLGKKERNIYAIIDGQLTSKLTVSLLKSLPNDVLGIDLIETLSGVTNLADSLLSGGSNTYKDQLAYWILGDTTPDGVLDANRLELGDPMHSNPVVINYGPGNQVVYVGTNSGYLHAFNTSTGEEVFSLIPEETLPNANFYMPTDDPLLDKVYGLDGPITYWHDDTNFNSIVDGSETVYLYIGMRRGGTSYYALNVTDPQSPQLLWQRNGAQIDNATKSTSPATSSGYGRLGQTWSALVPARVMWQGTPTYVLFAGGGYDPQEDGSGITGTSQRVTSSDIGNTVFMIHAESGSVLWSARDDVSGVSSNMTSAFPANVVPIDKDNNGFTDLIYAADVGGRVWRFDINTSSTSRNTFATGAAIADINTSESDGIANNRHFYNTPDIVYISEGTKPFVLVSIGSGYRAHPLSEATTDYHFLLKDPYGLDAPEAYDTLITMDSLADWESKNAIDPTKNQHGWYLLMANSGEKILGNSLTLDNIVFVNSFSPTANTSSLQCSGNIGESRSYTMRVPPYEPLQYCPDSTQPDVCTDCYPGQDCWCELKPNDKLYCPQTKTICNEDGSECEIITTPPIKPKCTAGFDCEDITEDPGLTPTPTRIQPIPDCDSSGTCTCEDYRSGVISGASLSEAEFDRCKLFNKNYWKEIQ